MKKHGRILILKGGETRVINMKDIIDHMIEYWEKEEAVELDDYRRDIIKKTILEQADYMVKCHVVVEKENKEQEKRLKLYESRRTEK